ncbi:DotH/IcmK family type IV secretion protein, partial [Klebsiella pneumoniae]|uniref:DotH/IcmK family type IV secretion protein n=1 Tax=Klebsiella pneumoniae TaxID=573 RepID=UPI001D0DDCA0
MTPDEVRQLRWQKENLNRALASPAMTVVPRISAQTVNLSPGSSLPLVRTAVNHPSNLSFTDATGAPWPVAGKPTNPMTKDFDVYYIPDSPMVTIVAKRPYASGSITVLLKGLSVPISVEVTSGDTDSQSRVWTVDNRLDLRIPQRGPSARPMAAPESKIGLYDNTLQAFLDGTPPREAHRLKATGQVPDTTVWQLGDDLFI